MPTNRDNTPAVRSKDKKSFEQVVRRIDPHYRLLRSWHLNGGVSAQVTALEVERRDGRTTKLIVRRHGKRDLEQNPHVAADEFRLLGQLQSAGVAVPMPYYLDESGEIFATPYLVIEYIEGNTETVPSTVAERVRQLASQLIKIHRVNRSNSDLSFLTPTNGLPERSTTLDETLDEGRIRETVESLSPVDQRNEPGLLHGDYWPGNILWRDGQLVAVIDWEDAAIGDPLIDLANSRLEMLWAFGIDAMNDFTEHYKSMTAIDVTDLPYWDLCVALRPVSRIDDWGLDDATKTAMHEGHKRFITQAFEKLVE